MDEWADNVQEVPTSADLDVRLPTTTVPIVVGIGTSAGGLEALELFLKPLIPLSGMAYVVIQHLTPHHHSILPELLQRFTSLPVRVAENDMLVEPNTVYVIPENVLLALFHGRIQLLGPTANMKVRLSVDYFFRSLARDLRDRAVAIVLSGTGSDGSLGLKAVKEAGGIVMVQDPTTTVFDGMPRSAIATGMVDFILPPQAMARQLVIYWNLIPNLSQPSLNVQWQNNMPDPLQQILLMLRTHTGHDFSNYKQSTIQRRVDRLMAINHMDSIADYVTFLLNNTIGVEVLFRDLLIGVTNFFRDKEVFETLKQSVIPHLFHERPADQPIRIWVSGCSTGEEAYSIAILLQEHMNLLKQQFRVQIFASDIDVDAVNVARLGSYSSNIEGDVPEEYLKHYFIATADGYKIVKPLRDMIVFAPHSVIKDPPFSRLDLVSCRNLLIYMNQDLQQKVLSYFHFALNPMGFLLLGSSESLGDHDTDFTVIHTQHKIFQRAPGTSTLRYKPDMPLLAMQDLGEPMKTPPQSSSNLRSLIETSLLAHWTPTCILVTHQGHIRYVHGPSRHYLEISGEADQLDIIRAVRDSLKLPLQSTMYRAIIQQRRVSEMNIPLETEGYKQMVNIVVEPFSASPMSEALLAVYFESVKTFDPDHAEDPEADANTTERYEHRYQLLQEELNDTRGYLQATIEELKSSNEEMQSINEELQSLNEELETSQEELKAVNEELMTTNGELEGKIEEVTWAHNDLGNTFNALQNGIILLDEDFQIRRFNPAATQGFKLIESDVGRSIGDIVSEFSYPSFLEDAARVFETLVSCELDVQTRDGRWYVLQIRPYRTLQNAIRGVVVSFNDVTTRKQMEDRHEETRLLAESVLNMVSEPFLILNPNLSIMNANQAFLSAFQLTPQDLVGRSLKQVGRGEWNIPQLMSLIESVFQNNTATQEYELIHEFSNVGPKRILLNVRQIRTQEQQNSAMVLIALKDTTHYP